MSQAHTPKILAGDEAILARRYARALFELAEEKKALDVVEAELKALQEAVAGNAAFRVMATNPRLTTGEVTRTVRNIAKAAKLNDTVTGFLALLAHNRRLSDLSYMIDAYMADLAEKRGDYTATVIVAKALSAEQTDKLAKQLGQMVGGTVRLTVEEDASLMGGMTIKMGSRLIDASVKGKLARLERQLKSQREAA